MSRVLRRPMFRGGYVDSEGTGITSGLMESREGYREGEFVPKSPAELARYNALKRQLETYDPVREVQEELRARIERSTRNPFTYTESFGRPDPNAYQFFTSPEGKSYIEEEIKKKRQPLEQEFAKYKLKPKQSVAEFGFKTDDDKPKKPEKVINTDVKEVRESDADIMNRYMEMFKANLAADKDELKSQRYFELAKFGLNLLSQPGGPPGGKRDLLGAIGRAGVPTIEGLSRISAEEKAAERQAKILGFQAALRELENPTLKKIQTLSKLTGISESEIAKKELAESSQSELNRLRKVESIEKVIESSNPQNNLSIAQIIVSMNKDIKDFKKQDNPRIKTGNEIKNQYYYFAKPEPGDPLVGKWDGKKFLVPGDEGF